MPPPIAIVLVGDVRERPPKPADVLTAAAVAAVVSGAPSTIHALAKRTDPLAASLAAGTLLLPDERRASRLLPAAMLAHAALSLGWAVVLAAVLPRRRTAVPATVAGLAIAAFDHGVVGPRVAPKRTQAGWRSSPRSSTTSPMP